MIELKHTIRTGEDQMQVTTIGIDLAKNTFHVVCCNGSNSIVRKKKLSRHQLLSFLANVPKCVVAMEACSTSNYWGRQIMSIGHDVKLLPAQHVKAFLTGNKNDYNDAHAIVVASKQSHIRAVPVKTVEQQDNQLAHNVRDLTVRQRTALSNHIRGFLLEYGFTVTKGVRLHLKAFQFSFAIVFFYIWCGNLLAPVTHLVLDFNPILSKSHVRWYATKTSVPHVIQCGIAHRVGG